MNPLVTDLALYDIGGTPGVAADVSHVNTGAQVKVGAVQLCVSESVQFQVPPDEDAHKPLPKWFSGTFLNKYVCKHIASRNV